MQTIRQIFRNALILITSLLFFNNAKATHIAAMDMWVTYVGAGQDGCSGTTEYKYEITLEVYSACEPNSAGTVGNAIQVDFWSSNVNNGAKAQLNVPLVANPAQPEIVDQLCAQYHDINACKTPANQKYDAYRKWTYKLTFILPSPQPDWKFGFATSNRNGGISNIINPGGGISYIECMLDNVIRYNNSTPHFIGPPIPYICESSDFSYLNQPTDPNKEDRLVTFYQTPKRSETTTEAYQAGYSLTNPVGGGFIMDSVSGTAYFTIPTQGKYVLGFRTNAYDKVTGALTGYTERDVQVKVFPCQTDPPTVDSTPQNLTNGTVVDNCFTGRGKFIYVCPGSSLSFDVAAYPDVDSPNNIVFMYADNALIPGSNFSVANDGTNHPVATFSWSPTIDDYGEYTLTVKASDSTCTQDQPIVLKSAKVFIIRVVKGLDAGGDRVVCQYNGQPQQLFVKGADCLNITWSSLDGGPPAGLNKLGIVNPIDTLIKPVVDHGYIVSTSELVGTCKNKDTILVSIDKNNTVETFPKNPVILCRPDYLQMDAVITGLPPLGNVDCGITDPIKCDVLDSIGLKGSEAYGLEKSYDTLGTTTPTFPNYESKSSKMQYLVSRADLWSSGLRASTLYTMSFEVIENPEPNHPYENFSISIKCAGTVDQLSKEKGFEQNGFINVYKSTNPIFFTPGWHEFTFDKPYSWDTTQNLIFEICYENSTEISVCNPTTGTAPSLRFVLADYVSSLSIKAPQNGPSVCNAFQSANINATQSRPLFGFKFCEAKTNPFKYTWTPGNLLTDSTIQQPLAYVQKSVTYAFQSFGRNGCILRDSVKVYVPEHNYSVIPADTAVCFGEPAPLHAKNGFTYKWYEYKDGVYTLATRNATCWDCADPILTPTATTIYKIVVYDSVWCTDTLTARVEVMPLPDVKILNNDTIVKYGQGIQLLVNGARTYNWYQASSMSNTNISNPIARPTERTDYVVGGIGKNGCRAFDTVTVDVDYRDNLFVPSGFSPNGDGKNDVFRISNLSFQRVMEFRVFNRWGQEVFYSNDNQHGWDGKWKGVPQDIGSYQYFIRLGYPDGLVETYKGEVTLVR